MAITPIKNEAEAVKLANKSIFGLAGVVWSKDSERAKRVAKQLEKGMVWINEYHLLNPGMPLGLARYIPAEIVIERRCVKFTFRVLMIQLKCGRLFKTKAEMLEKNLLLLELGKTA